MIYKLKPHEKGNTINQRRFQLEINDVVVDITGASILMEFKNSQTSKTKSLSTEGDTPGLQITEPTNGIFVIKEQIIDWPAGLWNFCVTYTFADNRVKTYIYGELPIIDKP